MNLDKQDQDWIESIESNAALIFGIMKYCTLTNMFGHCTSVLHLENLGHLVFGDKIDYRTLSLACHTENPSK